MTTLLCQITRKQMWVGVGKREDRIVNLIPEQTVYHNMFAMSVEIIKDLATFDIRVANFKFPENLCAVCSDEIKPKAVKKKAVK
jgi:hypothetical protein